MHFVIDAFCAQGQMNTHYDVTDCDDQFPKPEYRAPLECRNTDPYCLHVPKGYNNVYEEVNANVNGNDLRIKVPTKTAIIKKLSQTHVDLQSPYMRANRDGVCDAPCSDNQISLSFPVHATGDESAPLQNTQFCCTTEGCPQAAKHNVSAKVASRDRIKDLPNNRDNFVLKVMKTAVSIDKKCKLEFEIVTPKGPDKMPAVKCIDARNETIPECICYCPAMMRKMNK
ncbi:hypothetical protein EVAR_100900_1 [Eumeta japonica]|uniref:Uncharacterized protein n=1 Tax=Eumeta variegata TaxID=151549 RepID=A0A4C1STS5_EUMVA|nr:hypothetical protein EVAR_100900_1 [Eumeta japonica]